MDGFNKFQYSSFDQNGNQYVIRTDDEAEFKELVAKVKKAVGSQTPQAPVKQNSAISGDKPKTPYMWAGDTCPTCHKGKLVRGWNKTKDGTKYEALMCDQNGCYGKAYISKYPKPQEDKIIQVDGQDAEVPF
jgi:hypothetical protein